MIHLTPEDPSSFLTGVNPDSYWVRFGDVKGLTIGELKRDVILRLAPAHSPSAKFFIIKNKPDPKVIKPDVGGHPGEFINETKVIPDRIIEVEELPAAPDRE
jgi:hypothetical protein